MFSKDGHIDDTVYSVCVDLLGYDRMVMRRWVN
jgi:hypothetical protein